MGPGPPPLGPWGISQGLPGGNTGPKLQGSLPANSGHFQLSTLWIRIKIYVDFDVDFMGRFGIDLGSLFGIIFGHVGAFFGPSWSRNRLRTVLSSKKRLFTKHYVFRHFLAKWAPRWGQDRPKVAPRRVQDRLRSFFFVLTFRFDF